MRAIWKSWNTCRCVQYGRTRTLVADVCNMDEHTVIIGGTVDIKRLAVGGPFALFSSV